MFWKSKIRKRKELEDMLGTIFDIAIYGGAAVLTVGLLGKIILSIFSS